MTEAGDSIPSRKTGRPKGASNLRSRALAERLAQEGRDPAEGLIRIAELAEQQGELTLAADAWKALLPYVHARLKPVESDPDGVVALARRLKEEADSENNCSFAQLLDLAAKRCGID